MTQFPIFAGSRPGSRAVKTLHLEPNWCRFIPCQLSYCATILVLLINKAPYWDYYLGVSDCNVVFQDLDAACFKSLPLLYHNQISSIQATQLTCNLCGMRQEWRYHKKQPTMLKDLYVYSGVSFSAQGRPFIMVLHCPGERQCAPFIFLIHTILVYAVQVSCINPCSKILTIVGDLSMNSF